MQSITDMGIIAGQLIFGGEGRQTRQVRLPESHRHIALDRFFVLAELFL